VLPFSAAHHDLPQAGEGRFREEVRQRGERAERGVRAGRPPPAARAPRGGKKTTGTFERFEPGNLQIPIRRNTEIGCADARPIHENTRIDCGDSRAIGKNLEIGRALQLIATFGGRRRAR
jgi:hypothetical protein